MTKTLSNNFISVKEFAKLAGVSSQSVYKKLNRLNNELQTYSTIVDNKKVIDTTALWEVYKIEEFNPNSTKFATNSTKETTRVEDNSFNQELIQMLKKQLDEKDKQISELQTLLSQEQQLRLVEHQQLLEYKAKETDEQSKGFWSLFRKR